VYENPEKIPLLDEQGQPTGFSIGAGRHIPRPQEEPDDPCGDCGPGAHWIDQCPGGQDLMPTGALVGIARTRECQAELSLVLNGPVEIVRSPSRDDSANYPGLRPVDSHLDVIDTELVMMRLTGGGVTLRAGIGQSVGNPIAHSRGAIAEDGMDPSVGRSFFDVFFEVELGPNQFAYNRLPLRVEADVTCVPPQITYIHVGECIPLYPDPSPESPVEPIAFLTHARHGTYPTCGSDVAGDCLTPHETPACGDGACCEAVCALAPNCCATAWTSLCATLAHEICGAPQACCLPDGRCKDVSAGVCELGGGRPLGANTRCLEAECPRGRGDMDGDGDVDLADWVLFLACLRGPDRPVPDLCDRADLDGDGDVDMDDVSIFVGEFTGAGT
jgi:hypothetical protein